MPERFANGERTRDGGRRRHLSRLPSSGKNVKIAESSGTFPSETALKKEDGLYKGDPNPIPPQGNQDQASAKVNLGIGNCPKQQVL